MPAYPQRKKESMRDLGGCLGALAEMFHWTRALQGSSTLLATPDLQTRSIGSMKKIEVELRTTLPLVKAKGIASSKGPACAQPRDVASPKSIMYLQEILDAKQEPFVLQDVIRDKRHPIRPRSSQGLTLNVNEEASLTRRSKVSKKAKVTVNRHENVGSNQIGHMAGKYSLDQRMVAMPASNQALSCNTQNTWNACQCPSKLASIGKNVLKSPSKRALLMEAASKILEGSNKKSKVPSRPARCLLKELEGSRCEKELVEPPETMLREDVSQIQSIEDEGSKERFIYDEGGNGFTAIQSPLNSLHYDEKMSLVLCKGTAIATESRTLPHNNVLNGSEALNQSSSGVDAVQEVDTEQHRPNFDHSLRIKGCLIKSISEAFNKAEGCDVEFPWRVHKVHTHSEDAALEIPEVIIGNVLGKKGVNFTEMEESRDSVGLTVIGNTPSSLDLSEHGFCDSVDEALDIQLEMSQNNSARGFQHALLALSAPTGCTPYSLHHAGCEEVTRMSQESVQSEIRDAVTEHYSCDLVCDSSDRLNSGDEAAKAGTLGVMSSSVPLICKDCWWMTKDDQDHLSANAAESREADEFLEMSACSPAAVLVSSVETFEGKYLEEKRPPVFCDCSNMDECQQSSPVSVLDSIYEEGEPMLSSTFRYFDEARQKLLESVRRFEMLAHSDFDLEADCYSLDSSHVGDNMPSPDYQQHHLDLECKVLMTRHQRPSTCAVEYKAEGGLFPCSAGDSELKPIMDGIWGLENQSQRNCKVFLGEESELYSLRIGRDVSDEVAKHPAVLCVDAAWKCFDEEVEEVHMELESSLFGLLMQELLFDIMYQS